MEIKDPVAKRKIVDYEFNFISGAMLPVAVDAEAGDYVRDNGDHYCVYLAAKPSTILPDEIVDEEEVTIFKANLGSVIKRKRTIAEATAEEKQEYKKFIHKMLGEVQ